MTFENCTKGHAPFLLDIAVGAPFVLDSKEAPGMNGSAG